MAAVASPVIFLWAARALPLARRVATALDGAEIHGPANLAELDATAPEPRLHLQRLFAEGRPIIGIGASGILVRILAPCLADKTTEPPVIAIAEDGSAVVPLLGGHHGANLLATRIGIVLGVKPAITTASDSRFGVALDDPPPVLTLANPQDHKAFATALLDGARVKVKGEERWPGLSESGFPLGDGPLSLTISTRLHDGSADHLVYHPRVLAMGVGAERDAPSDDVIAFVREALRDFHLAEAAIAGVYSIDLKADEPAVHAVAAALGVPARFFSASRLEAETPRLANPSEIVFRETGTHSVAEAAALAAAGPEARLVVTKRRGARATVAIAEASLPFDGAAVGVPQGHLAIVGLGPGGLDWRTHEAQRLLQAADELVGFQGYLDLIGPAAAGKSLHAFALGEEEARVRAALDLAAGGRSVALVCSGDPGIYAMASLVWELIEREARPDWRRVALTVAPGVSALQAAAARIGAPLGHDFCTVSLSDLLTPWAAIERRLRAAAEGDFVVALYNPVSARRRDQLIHARDILLKHRPADTPAVLARQLGREGETVEVVTLAELAPDRADMLTVILIGSTATRRVSQARRLWVYTPRGYAAKHEAAS